MRFALPVLALAAIPLAACNVENDSTNDQVRLEYNGQKIEDAAAAAVSEAEEIGAGVGNVVSTTGRAVKEEIGDIDIDVDVTRNRSQGAGNSESGNSAAN